MQNDESTSNTQNVKQFTHEKPHNYNCECNECQIKLGSLPILLKGIERQEESGTSKIFNIVQGSSTPIQTNQAEPSTSTTQVYDKTKKTILCSYCNKSFTHKGDYNKHVRTHTGEQPYECNLCHKKFAHTSNLQRHIRVHNDDRPHICNVCNKNFNRKDKLDLHKKTKKCKRFSKNPEN